MLAWFDLIKRSEKRINCMCVDRYNLTVSVYFFPRGRLLYNSDTTTRAQWRNLLHKHLCLIYINYYLQIISFGVRKWQLAYCRKTKSVKYWLVIVQKIVGVFKREGMRVDSKLRWLPLWFTAQRIVKTLQVLRKISVNSHWQNSQNNRGYYCFTFRQ